MIKNIIIALSLVSIAFAAGECEGNYYYDDSTKLCVVGTLENCSQVGDTNTECTDGYCAAGYGFKSSDKSCVQCNAACASCDGATPDVCLSCASGYGIDGSDTCVECTTASDCETCDGDSPDACTVCAADKYLAADNTCGTCGDAITDCTTCVKTSGETVVCHLCGNSKFLKQDLSECETDNGGSGWTSGDSCAVGYGEVGGSCTACTGTPNDTACTQCAGTVAECSSTCLAGYSNDGASTPCTANADDANCNTFEDGVCANGECADGWYEVSGTCTACIEGCTDCQTGSPDGSAACSSSACEAVGYFQDGNDVCQDCGAGCNTCTSATECSDCIEGYRANADSSSTACWQCPAGCVACTAGGDTSTNPKQCIACISPCDTCTDFDSCETCITGYTLDADTNTCQGDEIFVANASVATLIDNEEGDYATYEVEGTGVAVYKCSAATCADDEITGRGEAVAQVGSTALTKADLTECGQYFVNIATSKVLIRADYGPNCYLKIALVKNVQVQATVNFDTATLDLAATGEAILTEVHAGLDVTVPVENLQLLSIAPASRRRMLATEDVNVYIKIEPCQEGADASACDVTIDEISTSAGKITTITVPNVTVPADAFTVTDVAEATDASAPINPPAGQTPSGPSTNEEEDADDDEEDGETSANITKFFGIVAIALMIVANYI